MEAFVSNVSKNLSIWSRRAWVRVRDNVPEVTSFRENTTTALTKTRVILADNLSALGNAIQSQFRS